MRRFAADEDGIVPSQFCERFWKFLKPAIVCEAAVPDGRVGPESNIQICQRGGRGRGRQELGLDRHHFRFKLRARDEPVVEGFFPEVLEVRGQMLADPIVAHDVMAHSSRLAE